MKNENEPSKPGFRCRQSMRLKGYDYTQSGMYFVTICVQMKCNDASNMLWFWFYQIEHKFAGIKCDECIVMPNHIYFIVAVIEAGNDAIPSFRMIVEMYL